MYVYIYILFHIKPLHIRVRLAWSTRPRSWITSLLIFFGFVSKIIQHDCTYQVRVWGIKQMQRIGTWSPDSCECPDTEEEDKKARQWCSLCSVGDEAEPLSTVPGNGKSYDRGQCVSRKRRCGIQSILTSRSLPFYRVNYSSVYNVKS